MRLLALLMILIALAGICPVALAGPGDGTVLGATIVVDNGPSNQRMNIVALAEGFTLAQQSQFNAAVDQFVSVLFSYPPFDTYGVGINVTRINVTSNESGADFPSPCYTPSFVNTYFDARYCNGGVDRALVVNNSFVFTVLANYAPNWDVALVIVNSTEWGGTGGSVAVSSLSPGWEGIVIHELGHSAFGLADEYEYYAGCGIDVGNDNYDGIEPIEPNVTAQFNRPLVKWNDLIAPSTPVPTTQNANCALCDPQSNPFPDETVGLYEGAYYYHCDSYRPQYNCMMRNLWSFCAVCEREIINTLTPYVGDADSDGVTDCCDNCRFVVNPLQENEDRDSFGDACDPCLGDPINDPDSDGVCANLDPCPYDALDDIDGDGDCADVDNCDTVPNPDQADADSDGKGDACDICPQDALDDFDQDGVCANVDVCPWVYNPDQTDTDGDGDGDACDNCPAVPNPTQQDTDFDGFGNACDNCRSMVNPDQSDVDADGRGDPCDNCLDAYNPSQSDGDLDGFGDACDNCPTVSWYDQQNSDTDSLGDACDNCPLVFNPGQEDADADSIGDVCDCACGCPHDPAPIGACDGVTDIVDVSQVINVAFRGQAAIPDPNSSCPYETTDVDCGGYTDIIDVGKMVNVAFRGANKTTEFCDPCP